MANKFTYIFLTRVKQVVILGLLVFMGIGVFRLAVGEHYYPLVRLLNTLGLLSGLVCVFAAASIFQPEDPASYEVEATLPTPFWSTILQAFAVNSLIIWGLGGGSALWVLFFGGGEHAVAAGAVMLGYLAVTVFFGGVTFWGMMWGRDARVGLITGLCVLSWVTVWPGIISREATIYALFNFLGYAEQPWMWSFYHGVYIILGGWGMYAGASRLHNTDVLLAGTSRRRQKWGLEQKEKGGLALATKFSFSPLALSISKTWGAVLYEGWIGVVKGPLFFALTVLWLLVMLSTLFTGWDTGIFFILESIATSSFLMRLLAAIFLPFLIVSVAATDRRAKIEPVLLATMSPRRYVGSKMWGIIGGLVFGYLLLGLPLALFVGVAAFSNGYPIYLTGYLSNLFLGVIPFLAYIGAVSVAVGLLARFGRTWLWGGVIAIGILLILSGTAFSLIGNILFPFGQIVADMVAYPLYLLGNTRGGIVPPPNPDYFLLGPRWYLVLPVISAGLQIIALWLIVSIIYARQVTSE